MQPCWSLQHSRNNNLSECPILVKADHSWGRRTAHSRISYCTGIGGGAKASKVQAAIP